MANVDISIIESARLTAQCQEKAVPLSLLDCTTANFSNASAIWLYERPTKPVDDNFNLGDHLRESLSVILKSFPQWSGHLKAVESTDGSVPPEASHFPPHARRFGRLYVHFGTENDPGVEFVHAQSSATLESLYPFTRVISQPIWPCDSTAFQRFMPSVPIAQPLKHTVKGENGCLRPLLAVQVTELDCGGFVLALKGSHPLADATTFMSLLKDWASTSQSTILGRPTTQSASVFDPAVIDSYAEGDINDERPDERLTQHAKTLPMHRYDWWAPGSSPPWPFEIPEPFNKLDLEPAGKVMPWAEWDVISPVSNYVIHFTKEQVTSLWHTANKGSPQKLSQHDAIVAHIWSCIARARCLQEDEGSFHCDLVYGVRPSFGLNDKFFGSPIVMMNIELPASKVCNPPSATELAIQVRNTLRIVSNTTNMAAHLHSLAFEKSPQRIWQAFLGQRHILVTTWARAGVYGIDFGLGSACLYAEGVVPEMDGNILIKEAPGPPSNYWTDNGVDISIHIRTEDMARLVKDQLLFPAISPDGIEIE